MTAVGSLRTDPSSKARGWWATLAVSRVQTGNGVWTLNEAVWVNGSGRAPDAVRGDRVEVSGLLLRPDDPGFAEALLHRGIASELQLDEFRQQRTAGRAKHWDGGGQWGSVLKHVGDRPARSTERQIVGAVRNPA